MFVVPNDILEKITCDICHKYLSVGPVLVENTKKLCGRCAKNSRSGIKSLYCLFGEFALFKCINRFGGCKKLLNYDQVLVHELKCLGKYYTCPLCFVRKDIHCAELLYHFKVEHPTNLITQNFMVLKYQDLQDENQYVYIQDDYIFIINLGLTRNKKILHLIASYFGGKQDEDINIYQKYTVCIDGKHKRESQATTCLPIEPEKNFKISNCFDIDLTLDECSLILINFEFSTPLTVVNPSISQFMKPIRTQRMIKIVDGQQSTLEKLKLTLQPCSKSLQMILSNGMKINIFVQCKLCQNISDANVFISTQGSARYLICKWCAKIIDCEHTFLHDVIKNGPTILYKYIMYSCIWNCGIYNYLSNVLSHENYCDTLVLPKIRCPNTNCSFSGMFEASRVHLKDEHNGYLWCDFVILYKSYKTYPLHNIQDLSDSNVFFVWVQRILLIKCIVELKSEQDIILSTSFVDFERIVKNVRVVVTNNNDKDYQTFCLEFTNTTDKLKVSMLPIRLHFVLNFY